MTTITISTIIAINKNIEVYVFDSVLLGNKRPGDMIKRGNKTLKIYGIIRGDRAVFNGGEYCRIGYNTWILHGDCLKYPAAVEESKLIEQLKADACCLAVYSATEAECFACCDDEVAAKQESSYYASYWYGKLNSGGKKVQEEVGGGIYLDAVPFVDDEGLPF